MKILVTGATGFIGSAVCQQLIGHTVIRTSRNEPTEKSGRFFKKSVSSKTDFSACLKDVDVIVHTAARVHKMKEVSEDPLPEFMEINCFGTLNLAKQAVDAGVKRLIFLSSTKVNGDKTEDGKSFRFDDVPSSKDPYSISKSEAETGLLKIAKDNNIEVVIIRPPLVYGPGVKANFLSLLRFAKRGLPFPLGSVKNKRSFVALDNLVDLIILCTRHPKAANKVFLVSDDMDASSAELFALMSQAFGRTPRLLRFNPKLLRVIAQLLNKKAVIDRLCDNHQVDIQHTKETLGWHPKISMIEGIKRVTDAM